MRQIEIKLIIKQKTMQMITRFTWNSSLTTNKYIYFAMTRSMLSHEIAIWYISKKIKKYRKNLNVKLKTIQKKTLRQIIDVYKAIFTKALQIETNTISINIHLRKLTQKSIINMNSRKSNEIIEATTQRIRIDLILKKKNRKSKLRKTSLQRKKKWMTKTLEKIKMKRNRFYITLSWMKSSKTIIIENKRISIIYHDVDNFSST